MSELKQITHDAVGLGLGWAGLGYVKIM